MEENNKKSDTVKNIVIVILSICVVALGGLLVYKEVFVKKDLTNTTVNTVDNKTDDKPEVNNNPKPLCFKENVPAYTKLTADLFEECTSDSDNEIIVSTFDFTDDNYYTSVNTFKGDTMPYSDVYWDIENYKPGSTVKVFEDGEIVININSNNIELKNTSTNKTQVIFNKEDVKFASVYVANATPSVSVYVAGKNGGTYYVRMLLDSNQNGEMEIAEMSDGKFGITNPIKFCAADLFDYGGGIPSIYTQDSGLAIIMDYD